MYMPVTENWQRQVLQNFFVKKDGDTTIENKGQLTDREIRMIREFIKENYKELYMKWSEKSDYGFYGE